MKAMNSLRSWSRMQWTILFVLGVLVVVLVFLWKSGPREITDGPSGRHAVGNIEKEDGASPSNWTVVDAVRREYEGPTIQIRWVHEDGRPIELNTIQLQPIDDKESMGCAYPVEGKEESIRLAYVNRAARSGELRVGTKYYANYSENMDDGRLVPVVVNFSGPELEPGKNAYAMTLSFPTPKGKSGKGGKKPSVELKGVAPKVAEAVQSLRVYYRDGDGFRRVGRVAPGAPFRVSVNSLGGDLVFSDGDLRTVYGVVYEVKDAGIGQVDSIDGHRDYEIACPPSKDGRTVEFFPINQTRFPVAFAVVPPNSDKVSFKAVPGQYRMKASRFVGAKREEWIALREVTLGSERVVNLE